jgi:hypothetical protein
VPGAFWHGQLRWPQGHARGVQLAAAAVCWQAPGSVQEPPQLPPELIVTMKMPGEDLVPMIQGHGGRPAKVCTFSCTDIGRPRAACTHPLFCRRVLPQSRGL